MSRQDKKMLMVLGMHRSGTSLITQLLHRLGGAVCQDDFPADQWNADGYWESYELTVEIENYLNKFGSSWCDARRFPSDAHRSSEGRTHYLRMTQTLRKQTKNSNLFVLKNPRICRLVRMFEDISRDLGYEPVAVIPIRHPGEVAASLGRRNGLTEGEAGLLWLRHVIDTERSTRNWRRYYIDDKLVIKNWKAAIQPLFESKIFDRNAVSDQTIALLDRVIKPQLRHAPAQPSWPFPAAWCRHVYEILLASSEPSDEIRQIIDQYGEQLDAFTDSIFRISLRNSAHSAVPRFMSDGPLVHIYSLLKRFLTAEEQAQLLILMKSDYISQELINFCDKKADDFLLRGMPDEAMSIDEAIIAPSRHHLVKAFVRRGWTQFKQKRFSEAAGSARVAVEIDPQAAIAHLLLSRSLREMGQIIEADRIMDVVRSLDPGYRTGRS